MDAIDALGELVKGEARGGRYFRRVATGNPKRPYRYYYTKEQYVQAHGEGAHLHGGDAAHSGSGNAAKKGATWNESGDMPTYLKHAQTAKRYHESLARYYSDTGGGHLSITHARAANEAARMEVDPTWTQTAHKETASLLRHNAGLYKDHPAGLGHVYSKLAEAHEGMAKYFPNEKEVNKSMDAIDALGCFFEKAKKPKKGARKPPYSEAQRRWAFAAEKRGELPEGDALKWSRRNAARKSEDESAQRGLYLGAEGERDSAVREMGALRAQPAYVQLEAGDDPFELLGKSLVSQARRQAYGDEGGLAMVAADCLYHGKDAAMLTGEAGAASGARCTCVE